MSADDADMELLARAGLAELEKLHDAAVAGLEAATGVRLVHGRPDILNASLADLERMAAQCEAFLDAFALAKQWIRRGEPVTLANRMKILPPDVVSSINDHLRAAGLLRE